MAENFKINTLLVKYMTREINQNELVNETKKIFHENLKSNQYNVEFIKEYYFMTEILGMNDCSKQECDNYVSHYLDIYDGKESLKSTLSVFLCKEQLSEEVLDIIYLFDKIILESVVSVQEKNRIKRFVEKSSRKKETIYDYVIEQLINIFQWGFVFDDSLLFEPKSILYICDEVDLKKNVYKKIHSIIASLLGDKPVWITCTYENGKCELQVVD